MQAKQNKQQASGNPIVVKYTSQGVSYDEMDQLQLDKENAEKEMLKTISNMLQEAYQNGSLDRIIFYFISTVSFCQTLNGDIYPAELGIAKFSLREGVFDSLHMYINPGKLPLGHSSSAQELSISSHQLPVPPNAKGLANYYDILNQIVSFVKDSKYLPVFFSNSKELKNTKMVFDKIASEAGEYDLDAKIYPLEQLFFQLKKLTVQTNNEQNGVDEKPFVSVFLAKDMIDRDLYMYTPDIGCLYHDENDCATHCALSKAKRWGFVIANHCCKDLRIQFVAGRHVPEECDVSLGAPVPFKCEDDVDTKNFPKSSRYSDSASSRSYNDNFSEKCSTSTRYSDRKPARVFDNNSWRSNGTLKSYDDLDMDCADNQWNRRGTINSDPQAPSSSAFSFANVVAAGRGIPASKRSDSTTTIPSVGRGRTYRPE